MKAKRCPEISIFTYKLPFAYQNSLRIEFKHCRDFSYLLVNGNN